MIGLAESHPAAAERPGLTICEVAAKLGMPLSEVMRLVRIGRIVPFLRKRISFGGPVLWFDKAPVLPVLAVARLHNMQPWQITTRDEARRRGWRICAITTIEAEAKAFWEKAMLCQQTTPWPVYTEGTSSSP